MSEAAEFAIGAVVNCEDGECGELRRVLVKSDGSSVTHLVVAPKHHRDKGRLVPIELVEAATARDIRLCCNMAQFDELDPAEEIEVRSELTVDFESQAVTGGFSPIPVRLSTGAKAFGWSPLDPDGLGGPDIDGTQSGMRKETRGFAEDTIPDGDGEVRRGQPVHALDGPIGHVDGLATDPSNHQLTYILLGEGHLWGEKVVAIPRSAVKFVVDDGIYLNLTKEQAGALPPADLRRIE